MDATLLLVFLSVCVTLCHGDEASDIVTHTVELEFYRLTTSEWNDNAMQTKVAAILASGANSYCSANPSGCALSSCCTGTAFKEINIGKGSNSAVDDEKNMLFKFYITLPAGANLLINDTFVLSSSIVIEIVGNVRMDIYDSIGYYIIWADKTYFGVPPATIENIVITVVAFAVLLLIIIIALFLHFWNKRREHNQKLQKKIEDKKSKKKKTEEPAPDYNVETETGPIKVPDHRLPSELYGGSGKAGMSHFAASPMAKASDTDSAIKMDDARTNGDIDDRRHGGKSQSLPPMKSDAKKEEDGEKKRKKRKKRKSKRTSAENEGYAGDSDNEAL